MKNIEDLIDTFENTGDNGEFFIGDYSNIEIAIYIRKQQKENKRLNNIINEIEKYLNEQIQKSWEIEEQCYEDIESKLQELKGADKE